MYKTIIDEIVDKIKTKYNGHFVCEEHRCDMFVYIEGYEETIVSICTDTIYFENDYHTVKFEDTDIHHLAYINEVI
tara:strand:+ start:7500 stop:7727 length:228 start_codon:yes stop_codon:yes gene_type:complete